MDTLFDIEPTNCPTCGRVLSLTGGCAWCENPLPALPYAGTSGWSGSSTSKARAVTADRDGTTSERQATVIRYLAAMGSSGVTVAELRQYTGWHHGQASGVLSVLHKESVIARLSESRQRCKVYVLPENVNGRDTEPHGRKPHASTSPAHRHVGPVSAGCPACTCDICGRRNDQHERTCPEYQR